MKSVELFAGAGGLALGLARAGFKHDLVAEWNKPACSTIRFNASRRLRHVRHWNLFQGDVRELDYANVNGEVDLLAGGPPCQPFSLGGKHRGFQDGRDMFPEMVRAIRTLQPRAVLIENVKGLLRPAFNDYFEYIRLQVQYPEVQIRAKETWPEHLTRLEKYHTHGRPKGLWYRLVSRLVNAADYGIPQRRERVIMTAFRSDVQGEWSFPEATHSREALARDKWITGDYWERHEIALKHRPEAPKKFRDGPGSSRSKAEVRKSENTQPWRTVREALADLPEPESTDANRFSNHVFNPGARVYPGHTGSPLDEPAKTLKAGDHGVPGGENMLAFPDGKVRYFTVRESARLQTFPDDFAFETSWTESMRQLGNAVPVELGHVMGRSIKRHLSGN